MLSPGVSEFYITKKIGCRVLFNPPIHKTPRAQRSPLCKLQGLFGEVSSLPHKHSPRFRGHQSPTEVDQEEASMDQVPRHGLTVCHSKAPEVLTSGSYRCPVYTQYKSVYCDWPHPIC